MNSVTAFVLALFAGFTLIAADAEAKRFGGGKSLGKQYSTPHSAPAAPQPTQLSTPGSRTTPATPSTPARSGASRWLGPLAGLAAGGLLASLFFGDAFEGFQFMDFLLVAALAVGGFLLFRALRRRTLPAPAAAGAGPGGAFRYSGQGGTEPEAAPFRSASGEDEAPLWFDGPAFAEGAKTHFIRLQAAWDQADFRDIREYTAPQLFAELQRERQRLGDDCQFTEVVTLQAELLGVRREDDLAVASVAFSGLIREEEQGAANRFREIWHIQHPWDRREGDWLIVGIQQQAEDPL